MKQRFYILAAVLYFSLAGYYHLQAQSPRKLLREGNKALQTEQPAKGEALYRRSLEADSTEGNARFGLANALYEQKKYEEAAKEYAAIDLKEGALSQAQAADIFHNMGNAQMQLKQYSQAAECYKQSLRLNPIDDETRYNLALALKLMEQNNQQSPQQNPQPQPQDQPQQDKNKEQEQTPPEKGQEIDPKTSKQILDSYRQDDNETRKKFEQRQREKEAKAEDKDRKRW